MGTCLPEDIRILIFGFIKRSHSVSAENVEFDALTNLSYLFEGIVTLEHSPLSLVTAPTGHLW